MRTLFGGFLPRYSPSFTQQPLSQTNPAIQFGLEEDPEDEFAYVEKAEQKAEAKKPVPNPLPLPTTVLDYVLNRFNKDKGQEFLNTIFYADDTPSSIAVGFLESLAAPEANSLQSLPADWQSRSFTGREFLEFLLSPQTVDPKNPPSDWKSISLARLGKSDTEIRKFLSSKTKVDHKGNSRDPIPSFLRTARNQGLIYFLDNRKNNPDVKEPYYGVPPEVRLALHLEMSEISNLAVQNFADTLRTLVAKVTESPKAEQDEELMESLIGLALTAVKQKVFKEDDLSQQIYKTAQKSGIGASENFSELINLLEYSYSYGTNQLFNTIKKLCELAVEADLLPSAVLREAKADLKID